jgi:hypothetical protein
MTGTTRVVDVDPLDAARHSAPADADEHWQESWGLVWYDPVTRAGGYHHISLQPVRGAADLWDYLIFEGEVVARDHRLGLPLPDDELSDLRLDSLHVRTLEPLVSIEVTDNHDRVSVQARYDAFEPPAAFSVDLDGVDIGSDHYESVGQLDAVLQIGGRTVEVRAATAYQDHSWGRRDWSALATHRWIWATFDRDLTISAIGGYSPDGKRSVWGYVHDSSGYRTVADASFNFLIRDDGYSAGACDASIRTADGAVLHVVGSGDVGSPVGVEGWTMTDVFSTFECNGRSGVGIMECSHPKAMPSWL